MLKKTITYTDFDGNERTEDHYFNLTKAELTMMELSESGGMKARLEGIVKAKDQPAIIRAFQSIIKAAYGVKSPDGRKFVKTEEAFEDFVSTEAYSELVMELCTDENAAAAFVKGIMPKEISNASPSPAASLVTSR